MVAVTTAPFVPTGTDWTVDDLDRLREAMAGAAEAHGSDDTLQYELLDGLLLITASPVTAHQRMARGIFLLLHGARVQPYEVFFGPLDWRPDDRTALQPDVLVVAREDLGRSGVELRPLALAVEVLSRSTRGKDRLLKFERYERGAIGAYWLLDPDERSIVAFELERGRYVEVGRARGDEALELTRPYPVTVVPGRLLD